MTISGRSMIEFAADGSALSQSSIAHGLHAVAHPLLGGTDKGEKGSWNLTTTFVVQYLKNASHDHIVPRGSHPLRSFFIHSASRGHSQRSIDLIFILRTISSRVQPCYPTAKFGASLPDVLDKSVLDLGPAQMKASIRCDRQLI